VLAGDDTHADPKVRVELITGLARAAGPHGMVGGQMIDLAAENTILDLGGVARLQALKTGAIIAFCCEAGAILGKAPAAARHALHAYAHDMGLAFQIADDLLDVAGDPATIGKPTGQDAAAGKATFVALLGVERARSQARMLADQAAAHLEMFGDAAAFLGEIARFVVKRQK
jgi:farnesyl diphosphate synthase